MGRDILVWSVGAADSGGGQGLPRVAHSGSGQGRASVPLCVREHVASSPGAQLRRGRRTSPLSCERFRCPCRLSAGTAALTVGAADQLPPQGLSPPPPSSARWSAEEQPGGSGLATEMLRNDLTVQIQCSAFARPRAWPPSAVSGRHGHSPALTRDRSASAAPSEAPPHGEPHGTCETASKNFLEVCKNARNTV